MSAPVYSENQIVGCEKTRVLLNPLWFYNHKYTAIVSYLKNKIFVKECLNFLDQEGNNLLHYFFLNCKSVSRIMILLVRWCVKIGLDINRANKKMMTPFYYYANYLFEKGFSDDSQLQNTFHEIVALWDKKTRHSNGNNLLHVMACYPFTETQFGFVKKVIESFQSCLEEKNNKSQLPLSVALSTWRKKETHAILYYMYLKTPPRCFTALDFRGRNVFHLACEYGLLSVVKHMLKTTPRLVDSKIMNEQRTPLVFLIAQNAQVDFLSYFLREQPQLITELSEDEKNVIEWLAECFIISSDPVYKRLTTELCQKKLIKDSFPECKKVLLRMSQFEKHGHYFCHICHEIKDPRNWEPPVTCRFHTEKFHSTCAHKWLEVRSSCPICDYKKEYIATQEEINE